MGGNKKTQGEKQRDKNAMLAIFQNEHARMTVLANALTIYQEQAKTALEQKFPGIERFLQITSGFVDGRLKNATMTPEEFLAISSDRIIEELYEPLNNANIIHIVNVNIVGLKDINSNNQSRDAHEFALMTLENKKKVFGNLLKAFQNNLRMLEQGYTVERPSYKRLVTGTYVNKETYHQVEIEYILNLDKEYNNNHNAILNTLLEEVSTYIATKKRRKELQGKISVLKILLVESGEGQHPLLKEMDDDIAFIKAYSTLKLLPNINDSIGTLYRVKYDIQKNADAEELFLENEILSDDESLQIVVKYQSIKDKYEKFHSEHARALQQKRNALKAAKEAEAVKEGVAASTMLVAPLYNQQNRAAKTSSQENSPIVQKPLKRYQMSIHSDAGSSSTHSSSSKEAVHSFTGMVIDPTEVGTIRRTGNGITKYFYLDMINLVDDPIDLEMFMHMPVKYASAQGESGLKSLKGDYFIHCEINGVKHRLPVVHELKHKHAGNIDRILCVEIPGDQKDMHESLIVGVVGVQDGLHDGAQPNLDPNKVYVLNSPGQNKVDMTANLNNNNNNNMRRGFP